MCKIIRNNRNPHATLRKNATKRSPPPGYPRETEAEGSDRDSCDTSCLYHTHSADGFECIGA